MPRLDPMEDRTLLSTLTVLNNHDSGAGSLRDTIANAPSGATIEFAINIHTIKLTSGELEINNKSLDIEGPGANNLTISSGSGISASRVFDITGGATVTLANLTIANGQTTSTGTSGGALGGGGILNDAGATLNLTRCSVVNNQATAGPNLDVFGGGLLNLGVAYVTSSTFTGNKAMGGGNSSTFFSGSQGGGIDNFGGATVKVDHSAFINNQVIGADTPSDAAVPNYGVGGAIENNAGFGGDKPSTATISYSTFTGNLATAGTYGDANGGAIDNEGSFGVMMTLTNCTLTGNRAIGGPGTTGSTVVFAADQGLGGGILNASGTLTVKNSTLIGNQAIGGAHSTPTKDNPLTGAGAGGGILNYSSDMLTVTNSTLIGNLAQGGAGAGGGGSGVGGGIDNTFGSIATITSSTLIGNQAIAGPGGSGASVPTGLGFGGGIDDSFDSSVTITNSTLIGNQAIGSDGSSGANGGAGWGGGIVVGINNFLGYLPDYFQPDTSSLIVSGSTLIGNRAQGGAGGSGFDGGAGWGGGIWFGSASTGTLDNSVITGNSAQGGLAGAGGMDGQGIGGGVYITPGADVSFSPKTVKGNHASYSNPDIYP